MPPEAIGTPPPTGAPRVPQAGDNAVINMSGITITHSTTAKDFVSSISSSAALNFSSGSLTVTSASQINAGFTLSGGTMNLTGTMTVSGGNFTLSGGTLSGTGTLSIGGTTSISGSPTFGGGLTLDSTSTGSNTLSVGTLNIGKGGAIINFTQNPLQWSGGGTLNATAGALTNAATGFISFSGTSASYLEGTLVNLGTFTQTASTLTFANGVLNNSGLYNIETSGTVMAEDSSDSAVVNNTGTFEESAASGLAKVGGGVLFDNAASGTIDVASGTLSLSGGGTDLGGNFTVSSGVLNLTGNSTLHLTGTYTGSGSGSIIVGSGTINIGSAGATFNFSGSLFQWSSGTINAKAGALTNTSSGTLTFSGATSMYLLGTLNNAGVINQTAAASSSNVVYFETAVLNNSGLYNIQENGVSLQIYGNGNTGVVNNSGTFEKTGPTTSGTATLGSVSFNNAAAGTVNVTSGCLGLSGGSTDLDGPLTVGSGSTLNLTGTVIGVFTGSGSGLISITGGPLTISSAGATFNFPQGLCQWIEGQITATAGVLTNTGFLTFNGISGQMYLDGTLNNAGTITQAGSSNNNVLSFDPGVLNNSGLYNIEATGSVMNISQSSSGAVNNTGTFEESASGLSKLPGVAFNNAVGGVVDVASGTLSLSGGGTDLGGNFTVSSGVLNLTGGSSPTLTGTYTGSGGGGSIIVGGTGTLDIGSSGATFNFPQGLFQWSSGTINAKSGILTNAATGTLTLSGTNNLYLQGTLNNAGVIIQAAATSFNELYFDPAVLNNSGLYNIEENGTALQIYSGTTGVVNNTGTFEKTGPTANGTATVGSVSFNNAANGTINVTSGCLSLSGINTDSDGSITVGSGSTLNLTGTVSGIYTGSGSGLISITGGPLTIPSAGATFNFPQGLCQWTEGQIVATAGILTNAATGFLTFTGSSGQMYLEGTLDNAGTITQIASTNSVFNFQTSVLNNSGLYNIETTGTVLAIAGPNTGVVNNTGTFEESAASGLAKIGTVLFNNAVGGVVDVASGTLSLSGGGTDLGGNFTVSSGVLNLTGGSSPTLMGTYTGSGGGSIIVGGTGTLDIGSSGATFNFPQGLFQWSSGTINAKSGILTNAATGTLTLSGINNLYLQGTLNNAGVIIQAAATSYNELYFDPAVMNNSGLYNIEENGTALQIYGSNTGVVNNTGTFEKTGPTANGTATVGSVSFNNAANGTINVTSGCLSLSGTNNDQDGNITVGSGSTLNLEGTVSGVYTGSGSGLVSIAAGYLTIASAGATFNFPQGLCQWTEGQITATAGALTNASTGFLTFTGSSGQMYLDGTLDNAGTITQAGSSANNVLNFQTSVLNNSGLYEIETTATVMQTAGGSGTVNNTGTFEESPASGLSKLGSVSFNNAAAGVIDVASGTLSLTGGGTDLGGNFTVSSGVLNLTGGSTPTLTGTYTGSVLAPSSWEAESFTSAAPAPRLTSLKGCFSGARARSKQWAS